LDVDRDAGAFLELAAEDRVGQLVLEALLDDSLQRSGTVDFGMLDDGLSQPRPSKTLGVPPDPPVATGVMFYCFTKAELTR